MFALRFVGTLNPSFLSGLPLSRPIVRVSSTIVLKLCRRIRKRLASFVSIVMLVVSYLRKLEDLVSLIASQVSAFRRCFFSLSLSQVYFTKSLIPDLSTDASLGSRSKAPLRLRSAIRGTGQETRSTIYNSIREISIYVRSGARWTSFHRFSIVTGCVASRKQIRSVFGVSSVVFLSRGGHGLTA